MTGLARLWFDWQKSLPWMIVLLGAIWLSGRAGPPDGDRAWFLLLLIVYMAHQVEEHLWPGGFRQFANAEVFHSGRDDWPVGRGGVALVNVGFVWAPLLAAALWPTALRAVGVAWMGLTAVNAVTHIVTALRGGLRWNPGLVTSVALFLPFVGAYFAARLAAGALGPVDVALALLAGAALHIPVAMVFVLPFRRGLARRGAGGAT